MIKDNYRWSKIETSGTSPAPRWNHSAVLCRESIFIFGGTDGAIVFDDLWEFKLRKINLLKNRNFYTLSLFPNKELKLGLK